MANRSVGIGRGGVARAIERWLEAGLIDADTAERLRRHEAAATTGPSRLALFLFGFGGLSVAAGILLFVAAHWPELGPSTRFGLLLVMVVGLHAAAGAACRSSPALATTLHAVGTAALGAGIFLAGQIFNLSEQWPAGLMLWSIGAALTLWLLRDWPHVAWTATLVPAWLLAEWAKSNDFAPENPTELVALSVGFTMLGVTYLSASSANEDAMWRRALSWLGVGILVHVVFALPGLRSMAAWMWEDQPTAPAFGIGQAAVWALAVGLPAGLAFAMRRARAWPVLVAGALAYAVTWLDTTETGPRLIAHLLYAGASVGLVAWGLAARHALRINLGVIGFALTVLWFYFGSLFDMLGRALGLVGIGLLLLGGGWYLERARRALVGRIREQDA